MLKATGCWPWGCGNNMCPRWHRPLCCHSWSLNVYWTVVSIIIAKVMVQMNSTDFIISIVASWVTEILCFKFQVWQCCVIVCCLTTVYSLTFYPGLFTASGGGIGWNRGDMSQQCPWGYVLLTPHHNPIKRNKKPNNNNKCR